MADADCGKHHTGSETANAVTEFQPRAIQIPIGKLLPRLLAYGYCSSSPVLD